MPRTHDRKRDVEAKVDAPLVAIVDDDALVLRSTLRLLRSFGFAAQGFGSAEDFLASGRAVRAACVILDVRMPGMDGLALQCTLADRGIARPIVFVTACASDLEEQQALRAGAVAVLRKPVEAAQLLRTLRSVIDASTAQS